MEAKCAFSGCQAGGFILETSKKVHRRWDIDHKLRDVSAELPAKGDLVFHPGCWQVYSEITLEGKFSSGQEARDV